MGLFSGETVVSRAYNVTPLKTSPELADDLWKNIRLRLNTSYREGGVNRYARVKHDLSRDIKRRYSSKYMTKAGISTAGNMHLYSFNIPAIENYLANLLHVNSVSVKTIGTVQRYNTLNDSYAIVESIVGDTKNFYGKILNDPNNTLNTYQFCYKNSVNLTTTQIQEEESNINVIEVYKEWIAFDGSPNFNTRTVSIPIHYNHYKISSLQAVMHPNDVVQYLTDYSSTDHWWVSTAQGLAGTIENGSLAVTTTIEAFTDMLAAGNPNSFTVTKNITGTAKGTADTTNTVEVTTDGVCTGTDSTTTTTNVTDYPGYYNKSGSITTTNGITVTADYTATGDMRKTVETTTTVTYTSGTRTVTTTDANGNTTTSTVNTCTKTTTTVTKTYYTCINYSIDITVNVEDSEVLPENTVTVMATTQGGFEGYVAVDNFSSGSTYRFTFTEPTKYGFTQDHILDVSTNTSVAGIVLNPSLLATFTSVAEVTISLQVNPTTVSTAALSALNPVTIPISYVVDGALPSTSYIFATEALYNSKISYPLTPTIPLKYNNTYYYDKAPITQAKNFIIGYLKALVTPRYDYVSVEYTTKTSFTKRVVINQSDLDLRDSIVQECDSSAITNVNELSNIVTDYRRMDIEALINNYESPVKTTIESLDATIRAFTADTVNDKTKAVSRVLKTLGIPEQGLDAIRQSISDNDVYTATLLTGIQLFDKNGSLLASTAKAKVLFLFAELLTGRGTSGATNNITVHADNVNATYNYELQKEVVSNFTSTSEYAQLVKTNKGKVYLMGSEHYAYDTAQVGHTSHGGWSYVDLYSEYIHVYKVLKDGSAIKYTFTGISCTFTSADGVFTISTKQTVQQDLFTASIVGAEHLDELVLVYPEELNWVLTLHEYATLYSNNLFVFTYLRHETKLKWWQTGFFGFVLVVAVVIITAITQTWESIPWILTALEAAAVGYGLNLMFPDMPLALKLVLSIILVNPAGLASLISSITSQTIGEVTIQSLLDSATEAVTKYIADSNVLEILSDVSRVGDFVYSYYADHKMEDILNEYKNLDSIREEIKDLTIQNSKLLIEADRIGILADYIHDMIDVHTYEPINPPSYMGQTAVPIEFIRHMSSTDFILENALMQPVLVPTNTYPNISS